MLIGFDWEEGPSLATLRTDHMCGTMTKTGQHLILVAGGHNPNSLAECEYLILPKMEWQKCKDLPMPLYAAQLVEDPETGDVLLIGGGTNQDKIYRLSDIDGDWILQDKTLQAPRSQFSAMVIPPGILSCNQFSKTKHDEL